MFSPRRAPKEGRTLPSYNRSNDVHRPRFSSRQLMLACIVAVCFFFGYFVFGSESSPRPLGRTSSNPRPTDLSKALLTQVPGVISKEQKLDLDSKNDDEPKITKPSELASGGSKKAQKQLEDEEDIKEDKKSKPKSNDIPKQKSTSLRENWSTRPKLDNALEIVLSLMPDEVHMRELIRPVESTGKERMREMGLRTRAYKKYFEAWENLHITEDEEGATYIRDDIIQYINGRRSTPKKDSDSDSDSQGLAQTIHTYEAYRSFLKSFGKLLFPWTAPWFGDHMTFHTSFKKGGRGIVLTVGDEQAPYVLTTIYTYRKLGCTLPIEVLYLGDHDLDVDYRAELESLPGVVTRDIAQMVDDNGWKLAGWAGKPFAILFSSFREVIFIDADALFFRNPETLFDDPDYVKHGALFFRDRMIMPESKKRWLQQILPKPIPKLARQSRFWTGESGHQMESGVVVVDKWKHFMALMLISRYNGPDRDGNKEKGVVGVYDMMYGDKETFWLGFLLAGDEDFAFHPGSAGILGSLEPQATQTISNETRSSQDDSQDRDSISQPTTNYTICAPQLLHLDIQGRPIWFNGWLLKNKYADKTKKRFADFDHYLIEPRELTEPHPWQLAESNLCCLTADAKHLFTKKEEETLRMIMDRAHEMGMGDQH